jgi:multiple sugar transport system permease protein
MRQASDKMDSVKRRDAMNNFVNRNTKWVFSVPALLFMLVMVAFPVLGTFGMRLTDFNFLRDTVRFIKLDNYAHMLTSREFWNSLRITFYYTLLVVAGQMLLGGCVSLILNETFHGKNAVKTIILMPYMMAPLAVGLMWSLFYEPSAGIINYFFRLLHLPQSAFVSGKTSVIPSIAAVEIWQNTPIVAIVMLAALAILPSDPIEASIVDGADMLQRFWYVKVPLLLPTITSCALMRFIDTFRQFDLIYALSLGGPANASRTLSLYGYELAFSYSKFGEAGTVLTLMFIMVLVIAVVVIELKKHLEVD